MADSVGLGATSRVSDEAYEACSSTSDTNTTEGLQKVANDGYIYHKVPRRVIVQCASLGTCVAVLAVYPPPDSVRIASGFQA